VNRVDNISYEVQDFEEVLGLINTRHAFRIYQKFKLLSLFNLGTLIRKKVAQTGVKGKRKIKEAVKN
jgi:hypothetical protein